MRVRTQMQIPVAKRCVYPPSLGRAGLGRLRRPAGAKRAMSAAAVLNFWVQFESVKKIVAVETRLLV